MSQIWVEMQHLEYIVTMTRWLEQRTTTSFQPTEDQFSFPTFSKLNIFQNSQKPVQKLVSERCFTTL